MAGVLARGRYRVWWTFAVFVATVLVTTVMMVVWPQRFYTGTFWERKETALDFMRFAVAIELAYRTFRAFPGALARLQRLRQPDRQGGVGGMGAGVGRAVSESALLRRPDVVLGLGGVAPRRGAHPPPGSAAPSG
jgi:hypothetical protein